MDVRQSVLAEKLVLRPGEHELRRYLTFAEAARPKAWTGTADHGDYTGQHGDQYGSQYENETQTKSNGTGPGSKPSPNPSTNPSPSPGSQEFSPDLIYTQKLAEYGLDSNPLETEPFGWLCNSTVVRLPGGGCLIYSPVLGPDNDVNRVIAELENAGLLPVRMVLAPSPQHHLALQPYRVAFPEAAFLCGAASGQMPPLTRKRRDIVFDGVLSSAGGGVGSDRDSNNPNPGEQMPEGADEQEDHDHHSFDVVLAAPVVDCEKGGAGDDAGDAEKRALLMQELHAVFRVAVLDDNRSGEVVLLHRASGTLILSDLLYKSTAHVVGPGGTTGNNTDVATAPTATNATKAGKSDNAGEAGHGEGVAGVTGVAAGVGGTEAGAPAAPEVQHAFTTPAWFAEGQEELFYSGPSGGTDNPNGSVSSDNSAGLLPSYRTHPRMRTIDIAGMRRSLEAVLAWPVKGAVCCHTDPISGESQVKSLLRQAWGWLWEE